MKRCKTWMRGHFAAALCLGFAALSALCGAVNWASDTVLRAAGRMEHTRIELSACGLVQLEQQADGWLLALGGDPQLLLPAQEGVVRRVRLEMESSAALGEVDLYYTRPGQEGFSRRQRVWAVLQKDGSYLFELPPGDVAQLRVDPGNRPGVRVRVGAIELNPPRAWYAYFLPGWNWLLCAAVAVPLAAVVLEWAWEAWKRAAVQKYGAGQ